MEALRDLVLFVFVCSWFVKFRGSFTWLSSARSTKAQETQNEITRSKDRDENSGSICRIKFARPAAQC